MTGRTGRLRQYRRRREAKRVAQQRAVVLRRRRPHPDLKQRGKLGRKVPFRLSAWEMFCDVDVRGFTSLADFWVPLCWGLACFWNDRGASCFLILSWIGGAQDTLFMLGFTSDLRRM